jgi:hypothetical protein
MEDVEDTKNKVLESVPEIRKTSNEERSSEILYGGNDNK